MATKNLTDWLKIPEFAAAYQGPRPVEAKASKAKKPRPAPLPLRAPERAGDVCVIPLPLPNAKLQPNRAVSLHWQEKGRLAKAMRTACGFIAAQVKPPEPFKRARLDITTWTANKVDPSNVWAWCKSAIDALADAGIIVNDRDLECGEILGYYGKTTKGRREMEFQITRLS